MNSRRNFLKGIATTLALPYMPSVNAASAKVASSPLRLAFVYIPNGVNLECWRPTDHTNLSESLRPLAGLQQHFSVLRGMDHQRQTPTATEQVITRAPTRHSSQAAKPEKLQELTSELAFLWIS